MVWGKLLLIYNSAPIIIYIFISDPAAGVPVDKLEELRNRRKAQKRKLNEGGALETTGEDALIDKAYIDADRLLLARLRADETPVFTRSTVLTTTEMVGSLNCLFVCLCVFSSPPTIGICFTLFVPLSSGLSIRAEAV